LITTSTVNKYDLVLKNFKKSETSKERPKKLHGSIFSQKSLSPISLKTSTKTKKSFDSNISHPKNLKKSNSLA